MNLTPTQKADELIEKFKDYVHGYVGSSMLTNTEYPEQIEKQAARCAIIAVKEILSLGLLYGISPFGNEGKQFDIFWQEVKTILTDRL